MVEKFHMKFQMDPDLPSVAVMQSSTHFRKVMNEMLHGNDNSNATERISSPRLPPIHLTDEESEMKDIENENSSKNIGKFAPNHDSITDKSVLTSKLEKNESMDNEFLQVPEILSMEIDSKSSNTHAAKKIESETNVKNN